MIIFIHVLRLLQPQLFVHNLDNTLAVCKRLHKLPHHILRILSCSLSSISLFLFSDAVNHSAISFCVLPHPIQKSFSRVHTLMQGETTLEIDFAGATCTCGCTESVNICIFSFFYIFFPVNCF